MSPKTGTSQNEIVYDINLADFDPDASVEVGDGELIELITDDLERVQQTLESPERRSA